MNKVEQFLNEVFGEVRVFKDNKNMIWFHANDCLKILDYKENGWNTKISRLKPNGVTKCKGMDSLGREQVSNYINEPNLYVLVFGSKMEKAEEFQDWICETVIPAIRKDGAYIQGEEKVAEGSMSEDEFVLKAMTILQGKVERLARENAEMKPKADYVDEILNSIDTVSTTQIAKDYGLSAQKLNDILKEEKIQYKQNKQWLLYNKYANSGYMKSDTFKYEKPDGSIGTKLNSKWTQQGRLFIHDILARLDIKPVA